MRSSSIFICFPLLAVLLAFAPVTRAAELPAGYTLQYEQSFKSPEALKEIVVSDPKAWRHAADGSLELFGKSNYNPKDRSPFNIALVADKVFGDFVLEAELQSTVKPYGHQDMCLYYGFEATNRFYYTHIAVAADPRAHNIFIVTNAPRLSFAKETTKGVTWGENQWHKVRIERRLADGSIKVYFDDFTKPIMTAEEKTLTSGLIGFGSFDDKGKVRNVKIWAPSVRTKKTTFFARPE